MEIVLKRFAPWISNYSMYSWFFDAYTLESKNLKFQIESLEINGLDDAAYECKECVNSISHPGSGQCITCQENNYYKNGAC